MSEALPIRGGYRQVGGGLYGDKIVANLMRSTYPFGGFQPQSLHHRGPP